MAKRSFDEILDKIEREAKEDGAEEDLARLRAHFRLGRRLAQRRLELGLSQQSLAARTGLQQAEISRIESGAGNPTFDTLQALSSGLRGRLEFRPTKTVARRRAASKQGQQGDARKSNSTALRPDGVRTAARGLQCRRRK